MWVFGVFLVISILHQTTSSSTETQQTCDSCRVPLNQTLLINQPDLYYFATNPQPSHFTCKITDWNDPFYDFQASDEKLSTFWYPARRKVRYGPYEYVLWGDQYGQRLDKTNIDLSDLNSIGNQDCLVENILNTSNAKFLVPQMCNSNHLFKCVASSRTLNHHIKSYCSSCPYCFDNNSKCSIQENSSYFTLFNSIPVSNDMRVLCPDCFQSNTCFGKVNMVLTFNEKKRTLYLAIYSPECIYNWKNKSYIYCFTDASDKLRKKVDIDLYLNQTKHPSRKDRSVIYNVRLEKYMGTYWCEAYSIKNRRETRHVVSNNVTAYKVKVGNEFSVKLKIKDVCSHADCEDTDDVSDVFSYFKGKDLVTSENILGNEEDYAKIRLMAILNFDAKSSAEVLIHLSILSDNSPEADYEKLQEISLALPEYFEFLYIKSSEFCNGEHQDNLTWPPALPYQAVMPEELCLQDNGFPVWRVCIGNFLSGYYWDKIKGSCSLKDFGEDTVALHNFSAHEITEDVIHDVTHIVEHGNLSVSDLFYVSQILDKFADNATSNVTLFDASLDVVNELLKTNYSVLANAQDQFNLTDTYLRIIENVANNLTESQNKGLTIQKHQILVHAFNPLSENASGLVLFQNLTVKNIGNFSDVHNWTDVDLALYVPTEDIQSIRHSNLSNVSIVAVVYLSDSFFYTSNSSNNTPNLVINLNIPNYDTYLRSRIPVLIRTNSEASNESECVFWDYGDLVQPKKGTWSTLGGEYGGEFENDTGLKLCYYSHLTHLALLIADRFNAIVLEESSLTNTVLSWITAIGSLVSCAGLMGIFATALTFRSWRSRTGTQILLNLSVAILLEIIFMYVNDTVDMNCTFPGFVLQYLVICKFSWMLVYAFCQYLRFVRVFGPMPRHLVLKSVIFGWGFGLIPSLTVLISDPETYNAEAKFCYPTGISLYLGIYLPILVILSINLCVFCKILYEITSGRIEKVHTRKNRSQHVKLAVLLCSVLGIPWIVGFLFNIVSSGLLKTVFVYIFTISSALQGFVMFLFYVAFNPETRAFWSRTLSNKTRISSKNSMSVSIIS
ncbi:adhesion G-protein coupled receptor G6-like [Sitophilus oryzae]|uniref:Adhesion G-protein coupled receptor G6-like n=1 Tax=Sitophilus oryzae TaxID=7048 RepID=A0A6J2YAC3_SITOR|nr:adhesion G-protein coupled receptor G6-like [Sitophilus oryzae]